MIFGVAKRQQISNRTLRKRPAPRLADLLGFASRGGQGTKPTGSDPRANAAQRHREAGQLDLAINCDGFNPLTQTLTSWLQPTWVAGGSLRADGRAPLAWGDLPQQRFLADPDWDSPAFLARHAEHFKSNQHAELLCRMVFLEPNADDLGVLDLPGKNHLFEVLSHGSATTTRAAKIWHFQAWHTLLQWCASRSIKVGLVGAPPATAARTRCWDGEDQLLADHLNTLTDLRGRTNLIQLAGACRKACRGRMRTTACGRGSRNTHAGAGRQRRRSGTAPVRSGSGRRAAPEP